MNRKPPTKKRAVKKKTKIFEPPNVGVDLIEFPAEILSDPRKALFLRLYLDHESATWGNAKQSAIRAGFTEDYANNITALKPKWLYEFIGQQDFVQLAETHLKEVLMLPNVTQAMGAFGPLFKTEIHEVLKTYKNGKTRMVKVKSKIPIMVANTSVIKVKNDASKVVLPAHDPTRYKVKEGNKTAFIFNVQAARDRYNGNDNARIPANN